MTGTLLVYLKPLVLIEGRNVKEKWKDYVDGMKDPGPSTEGEK